MQAKQFWKEQGWVIVVVFIYLSTTKGNLKTVKRREGEKEPWTISGTLRCFDRVECPSLLGLELRFQRPARRSYSLLLPQCLWYKMQLICLTGVYSLTGVLRRSCDICDRCLRGPEYLQSIVVDPEQMLGLYGLHKDCLIWAQSVTCIFLFQVTCKLCDTESQGNNQYKSLKRDNRFFKWHSPREKGYIMICPVWMAWQRQQTKWKNSMSVERDCEPRV